jgi:hypothetical protein
MCVLLALVCGKGAEVLPPRGSALDTSDTPLGAIDLLPVGPLA